jgi:hypothetical protein
VTTVGGEPVAPLIVCPTSLVPNWMLEAALFASGLKVLALQGRRGANRPAGPRRIATIWRESAAVIGSIPG